MTVGDPSHVAKRFSDEFQEILSSCRARSEYFDTWQMSLGKREDKIRKAFFLAAHWSYVIGLNLGESDKMLLCFRNCLVSQTRDEFDDMLHRLHINLLDSYRRGEFSLEALQDLCRIFHDSPRPTTDVVDVIMNSRAPDYEYSPR